MKNAWVSLAELEGEQWFRSVAANPLAEPERVFAAALEGVLDLKSTEK